MRLVALAIPVAILLTPTLARADQCAINDQAIADKAVELAKKSPRLLEMCEPCGEKLPKGPYAITNVTTQNGRVMFDGRMLDLAYTFIYVGKDKYQNLGLAAGCKAERVSKLWVSSAPVRVRPPTAGPGIGGGPPPRPYPARNRVSSPDDLAGNWDVKFRPNLTTCAAQLVTHNETWTISVTNSADITVNQGTGTDDFVGSEAALDHGMYKPQLSTISRPSANVLQISQSLKDIFWGKITRAESSGKRGDPACLTVYDISANRAP